MTTTKLFDKQQRHTIIIQVKSIESLYIVGGRQVSWVDYKIADVNGNVLHHKSYSNNKKEIPYTVLMRKAMLSDPSMVLLEGSDVIDKYSADHVVNKMVKLENVK